MASVSRRLSASILSMSLLTVMAGAAVAPALGAIKTHFSDSSDLTLQFSVSMPALFIILANIIFPYVCRFVKTKTLALVSLLMYVVLGVLPFFVDSLPVILVFRALLGISVGLIMPLSTGLIAYCFARERQSELMGLSGAMNMMGGVIATLVAGLLAGIGWNASFLVYLFGLIPMVMVALWLPNVSLESRSASEYSPIHKRLMRFHKEIFGMFMFMVLFFVYPSTFAIAASKTFAFSSTMITVIMVGVDLLAFFVGMVFGRLMRKFGRRLGYSLPIMFFVAFILLAFTQLEGCFLHASVIAMLVACALVGVVSGIGAPFYNSVASMEAGPSAATTVIPLLSASLYAGQFLSPIIISKLGSVVFGGIAAAPYLMAAGFAVIYFIAQHIHIAKLINFAQHTSIVPHTHKNN